MKILVINGSPKCEKSDTIVLTRAFLSGVNDEYEQIDLIRKRVGACLGCMSCWYKTPGKCVQNDDAEELLEKIAEADHVVWSMPLYSYGMPSHVKALIDRFLPFSTPIQATGTDGNTHHALRRKVATSHVLISGCGFPDFVGNFEGLQFQFKRLFGQQSFCLLCPEAPMLTAPQAESLVKPYLKLVAQAGKEYFEKMKVSEQLQTQLSTPMLNPEIYRKICSGEM